MHLQEIRDLQYTRTELWQSACRHEITVDELYRALKAIRDHAGDAVYEIPKLGRR